ncbi:hypothetical protein C3B47_07615 [Flavobacterium columnare]|nr:hypothetical protein [Flavobacterium columnare]MBF6658016.1 hypothetical protein [Flavobacterium columnare]PTD15549.1 hypothetical protein C6N29_14510 [Flavobacterium columnare]QOH25498.1 hypothetical protein GSQ57_13560 [Flavobacterium columnare]
MKLLVSFYTRALLKLSIKSKAYINIHIITYSKSMNSFLIRFNLTSKKEDANFLQKINERSFIFYNFTLLNWDWIQWKSNK